MHVQRLRYSRRQLMQMVFGGSALASLSAGCDSLDSWVSGELPGSGEILSPNRTIGHRLRMPVEARMAGTSELESDPPVSRYDCVVVGAGAAGLSAAWHLKQNGIDNFRVLELESVVGGTSRSGIEGEFSFPWGAHYLPVPKASNPSLLSFLKSCGVVESITDDQVVVREDYLCRDPEERVFVNGTWRAGLIPDQILSDEDSDELKRFQGEMQRWAQRVGEDSKAFFTLPTSACSEDPEAVALDQVSFSQWMQQQGFKSSVLQWLVEYSCMDDYGIKPDQTSAWAGIFYFAARIEQESGQSREVMTWPSGNGFLVDRLAEPLGDRIDFNQAVMRITSTEDDRFRIESINALSKVFSVIEAEHVILAVPQFIAKHLIPATKGKTPAIDRMSSNAFTYGSWLVANIYLDNRPAETGFPMAWDNVSMASSSLGYVNSFHQTGRDYGPTILTWYTALPENAPKKVREQLMTLSWAEAAETVLSDLEKVHPDIRSLASRLDVMVWGHAMVQPRVGTIFHPDRKAAAQRVGNLHFACTDLSGVALFEEAFDHGRRAAMEVIASRR